MPTLREKLDSMRHRFKEAGMTREWRELQSIAVAANTTQLGAGVAIGTLDYATNCTPDAVEKTPREELGRGGIGDGSASALYPSSRFPSVLDGFGS